MSRHTLKPKDPSHEVVVGWDPPLGTFFLQVHEPARKGDEDEDGMVDWLGFGPGEIPTVEALAEKAAPYAELPMETRLRLAAERLVNNGDPGIEGKLTDALLAALRPHQPDEALLLAEMQELRPMPRQGGVGGQVIENLARMVAERGH